MPKVFICPNGHRWEVAESPTSRGEADAVCPLCGTVVDPAAVAVKVVPSHSSTDHLPDDPSTSGPTEFDRGTHKRLPPLQGQEEPPHISGYEILGELGRGGMGIVYKARDLTRNRLVALKVIRQDRLTHAESVRRFRREAQAAARVSHPNVVRIYDSDYNGDTHYLIIEYVDGVTLQRVLEEEGPQPVARACEFIRQAALGLEHIHEQGLVHRDVKPANLMLTQSPGAQGGGLVKILDMGVAKLYQLADDPVESLTTLTQDGAVIGTADFIAPEQLEDPRGADIRADLYSLGCTFYVLLTGQVPFPGGTLFQKLERQRNKTPPAVDQLRPEVPGAVVDIVRRLMAKKAGERYQTPGELADALQRLAQSGHIAASARPVPRRETRQLTGHREAVWCVALSPDGQRALSGSKDRTIRLWDVATGHEIRSFPEQTQEVRSLAFAPDGRRFLSASGVSLRLWDADSGAELARFTGHTDAIKSVAFAPDDTRAVSGG
ncbi:MAG TPA: serine/threonine-protein kinase, partial [Gemmataceae bacterium]|nr:serine/threonine-protein kinase [Gemmataceae bacterium]